MVIVDALYILCDTAWSSWPHGTFSVTQHGGHDCTVHSHLYLQSVWYILLTFISPLPVTTKGVILIPDNKELYSMVYSRSRYSYHT